jgi:hypothetical protein
VQSTTPKAFTGSPRFSTARANPVANRVMHKPHNAEGHLLGLRESPVRVAAPRGVVLPEKFSRPMVESVGLAGERFQPRHVVRCG